MEELLLEHRLLPWRGFVLFLLGLSWIISALAGWFFLSTRSQFPSWFGPVFLLAILLLLGVISFYIWQVLCKAPAAKSPGTYETGCIWLLLVLSVICTSALHKFFPFRLDVIQEWSTIPPRHNITKYNLVLTACSLLIMLALIILYSLRCRRAALIGLLILAAVMLVPNENCGNPFNRPWVNLIGASPMMFLANSVVLLIGYCTLHGIRPRVGIGLMSFINFCVLLLGLGHITHVVW